MTSPPSRPWWPAAARWLSLPPARHAHRHALAPVLKVTANRATYQNMIDNMDIDASGVTEGEVSIEEAGASMLDEVLEVCNGKTTKAESYGFSDIAIDRICRFI